MHTIVKLNVTAFIAVVLKIDAAIQIWPQAIVQPIYSGKYRFLLIKLDMHPQQGLLYVNAHAYL